MFTDLAWECLRRNKYYVNDWMTFLSSSENKTIRRQMLKELERKWGLLRYCNPLIGNARGVFWGEAKSSRSIRVRLHEIGCISSDKITQCNNGVSLETLYLQKNDICLKRYNATGYCQIFIDKNDFKSISPDKYIYFSLKGNELVNISNFLNDTFTSSNPCDFRMNALHIYDKVAQGFSQREIAVMHYGEKIVNSEWGNDSWLRARIRYKLKIAKSLIYEDFIKYI